MDQARMQFPNLRTCRCREYARDPQSEELSPKLFEEDAITLLSSTPLYVIFLGSAESHIVFSTV